MSSTVYCYDCDYCHESNSTGTVCCYFLCRDLYCVLCHDLYHVLDRRIAIDSETDSAETETGSAVVGSAETGFAGAGREVGIVGKEEAVDVAMIVSSAAFVASAVQAGGLLVTVDLPH